MQGNILSGNTRGYNPGCIAHVATSKGSHKCFTSGTKRMTKNNAEITATEIN